MRQKWTALLAGALFALASGCSGYQKPAKCIDNAECDNVIIRGGRCLNSPYGPFCAFPDKDCPTMWRWYEFAHASIMNQCVDPSVPLDAAIDAPIDMSTGS